MHTRVHRNAVHRSHKVEHVSSNSKGSITWPHKGLSTDMCSKWMNLGNTLPSEGSWTQKATFT